MPGIHKFRGKKAVVAGHNQYEVGIRDHPKLLPRENHLTSGVLLFPDILEEQEGFRNPSVLVLSFNYGDVDLFPNVVLCVGIVPVQNVGATKAVGSRTHVLCWESPFPRA